MVFPKLAKRAKEADTRIKECDARIKEIEAKDKEAEVDALVDWLGKGRGLRLPPQHSKGGLNSKGGLKRGKSKDKGGEVMCRSTFAENKNYITSWNQSYH